MDNQNYAAQFYSGISIEIDILEKNIEEYPASSVVRFMWLYHLKKNNNPSINEVFKQTGVYLNNPLWMEYQLSKSEIDINTVSARLNESFGQEEISQNLISENENHNPANFNEQKSEAEIAPEAVNEEILQNPISENEFTEIKNEEIINEPVGEIENENSADLNEQKLEEEITPDTVNEEILQNPILENETSEIKNEEIINEPPGEIENKNSADLNEQKPEAEIAPDTVNQEIPQNPISENEFTEIKNEEVTNEPSEEIEHENTANINEQKPEEEILPEAVNQEIAQNPISENEFTEIKNEEVTNEPSEEIEHENTANINEQKPEEEILPEVVNQEIAQNPILENEEDNINEDQSVFQVNPAEVNQTLSDKPFSPNENHGEEMPIPFEPLHTVDYFASQGIKLSEEALANDHLGQQVKSFTAWLKTMKKLHPGQLPEQNEVIEKIIQSSSEASNQNANVLTEAMAEVLVKQGKREKAVGMYEKLSLINPSKSAYFAAKIENLKTI